MNSSKLAQAQPPKRKHRWVKRILLGLGTYLLGFGPALSLAANVPAFEMLQLVYLPILLLPENFPPFALLKGVLMYYAMLCGMGFPG